MSNRWTETQLATIGAQAANFPQHEVLHWRALRAVPERVREILRDANEKMSEIESDRALSQEGVKGKRAALALEALAALRKISDDAEKEAAKRRAVLQQKIDAELAKSRATDAGQVQVAAEVRAHIARAPSPIMEALRLRGDAKVLSAVLEAPAFLSGLSDSEKESLRAKALESTETQKEIDQINQAINVCHQSVKSATAMISARASIRQRYDGGWEAL